MEMRGRTVCKDGLEGVYAVCDDQACTGSCQLFLGTPALVCLLGFSFQSSVCESQALLFLILPFRAILDIPAA